MQHIVLCIGLLTYLSYLKRTDLSSATDLFRGRQAGLKVHTIRHIVAIVSSNFLVRDARRRRVLKLVCHPLVEIVHSPDSGRGRVMHGEYEQANML